jgi:type II secretory pathway component PulK
MSKKGFISGQVLIIFLWILVILSSLSITLGKRAALALKFSGEAKNSFNAYCLIKAGLNRVIAELKKDQNLYDGLDEDWNKENAGLKVENFKALITDEEKKININKVSPQTLIGLLENLRVANAPEVANNIFAFIKERQEGFSNIYELNLVEGVDEKVFEGLKGLITVYTDGLININTASGEVLNILTRSLAEKLSLERNFADGLINKIMELRNRNGSFKERQDLDIQLTTAEETNIFNQLLEATTFQSRNFLIEVNVKIKQAKYKIIAVYNRKDDKMLYWQEG